MKRILAFSVLAATIVASCATTGTTTSSGAPAASGSAATGQHLKIGLVTDIGGLNDKSFNSLADAG
ncbi:MAG: BMP family ABC transporter substrate-binding protein, partial [Chloroflexota bacterium]|nr:BMP family ABC transporter substrate-binding protein [Chloroflexota bacterium]